MKTVRCLNPQCQREFTLDADHRFGGQVGIVITRAPINRKFGRDNREASDE